MGTVARLYLGWRLFRLLRPVLAATLVAGALLAFHRGHVPPEGSAAPPLQGGAAAAGGNLPRALEPAFQTSRR